MEIILDNSWQDIKEIFVYGNGKISRKNLPILKNIIDVRNVIDRISEDGAITLEDALRYRIDEKIIVSANKEAYKSISRDLVDAGLVEYVDYIKLDDFLMYWMYQFRKKNCIREVHYSINTKCDFKCKKCNMFMTYYKESFMYNEEDVETDLELFFAAIDFVMTFSFLGGEPFINPRLEDILNTTYMKFGEKIGRIELYTNGSVIPNEELLSTMKKCNVFIRISDYTEQIAYSHKLKQFEDILSSYGIPYEISKDMRWLDFKFPDESLSKPYNDIREHMLMCSPAFHGLNDGKFYYCHVCWSAEKAKLFQLKDTDYIDLRKVDSSEKKRQVVYFANGEIENEGRYITLCQFCAGCGDDNKETVVAAEQIK